MTCAPWPFGKDCIIVTEEMKHINFLVIQSTKKTLEKKITEENNNSINDITDIEISNNNISKNDISNISNNNNL
jgi:hypothetical protein